MEDINFKKLSELRIELFAHTVSAAVMGDDDLIPCSTARVSHGLEAKTGKDAAADDRLLEFLATNNHLTPFEHQSVSFLVEAPIFVAREWMRHRTQSFNEISMRYTSEPANTFWVPDEWRVQASRNKQSSGEDVALDVSMEASTNYEVACAMALDAYRRMIAAGVAREMARAALPVGMVTRFICTANLRNWAHWVSLRIAPDAQKEIQHYAQVIDEAIGDLFPRSWKALTKDIPR